MKVLRFALVARLLLVVEKLLGEFMAEVNKIEIPNQSGEVVAELVVPEEWEQGTKPPRPGYLWISKFFVSPKDERVGVCLRDPAKKTYHYLEAQQNPFLELLRRPAHELSEDEFLSVHLMLEQVGWPGRFKRDYAKTVEFESTNVLEIQGLWLQENIRARGIIVDTTFDGDNFVQEAWFVAPPEVFDDFADEADQIFASLQWSQSAVKEAETASA